VLLDRRDLFRRYFDAKIATRDHDAVSDGEDCVEVLDGLRLFELCNDPGIPAVG
jgi:hypothetical protein